MAIQPYAKNYGEGSMHHRNAFIIILILIAFVLSACGSNVNDQAALDAANTQAAVPPTFPPLPTSIPTDTATSLPMDTPTPVPTDTPTPTPTITPTPTDTPTITPTPGPFTFFDDFTTNSGGWEGCELCKWENGGLVVGLFPPTSNFHYYECTGCEEATYYKIAVDANFLKGQVDRFFGVMVGNADGEQYYLGISPWQFFVVGHHYDSGDRWDILDMKWSGVVNASYATNHFEVQVRPATKPGAADIVFSLNGTDVFVAYSVPAGPTTVGLAMDWHAVTSNYDNWEYTVLEP